MFWLVAIYVGAHIVVVFAGLAFCAYYGEQIVTGKYVCDPKGRLVEILNRPFDLFQVFGGDR